MTNDPIAIAKRWTVSISGTDYPYIDIDFEKVHPSPNPDIFTVTLSGKKSLTFFSAISIKKDNVQRFYGYIEKINYEMGEEGINTIIGGRCRKVILWKKWTERFTDTRISGFFANVYPKELIMFLLRCPVSEVPDTESGESWEGDFPRQKIGWGINSDSWGCTANVSSIGTEPDYVKLRLVGFYWRNRGTPSTIEIDDVAGVNDGPMGWTEVGAVGHNCIVRPDDDDTTYIRGTAVNQITWDYTFTNLPVTADTINSVEIIVRARKEVGGWGADYRIEVRIWDGSSSTLAAYIVGNNQAYDDVRIDITDILDTPAKYDAAEVYFTLKATGGTAVRITTCYMIVDYGDSGAQTLNDYFKINFGRTYDRVTGIIVQSRHTSNAYPRYYKIETGTAGEVYTQRASNPAGGNVAQDIIHSWTPVDGVQYVKITITQTTASIPWEITQIYIYTADDADYTVLESTVSPNISLTEANIKAKSASPYLIADAINLPFQRLTDAMEQARVAAFDTNYDPWEWWIDESDGQIHFDSRKGTSHGDKIFEADLHLAVAIKGRSITKTIQRLRVVGRGEGRRQDEISSKWKENAAAMGEVGTFYEELISEKTISNVDTANAWAEVYLKQKKDIIQEIEVDIERDPYDSGSWDVGDDVKLKDSRVDITEQLYRIKRLHVTVSGSKGEKISLTVTNAWQDITDKIADLFKKISQLQLTGTEVEDWVAEGADQGKIKQDKIENIWEMKRQYEESDDFQEVGGDISGSDSYITNANWDQNGRNVIVSKDEMTIYGRNDGGARAETMVTMERRFTDWNRDPRFMVKLKITGGFVDGGDFILFDMVDSEGGNDPDLFGFRIDFDGAVYTVLAIQNNKGGGLIQRAIATITTDTMYEFEAKVDWNDKMVFYYINGVARAVIPLQMGGLEVGDNDIQVMFVRLDSGNAGGQAVVEFFLWQSQSKKESAVD